MKTLLITSFLFVITACGLPEKQIKKVNIHPDAQAYVSTFESKYGKIDDLEVTFRPMAEDTAVLAYCQRSERHVHKGLEDHVYKTPLVVINTNYWNKRTVVSDKDKELLIYHELGHCILNRMHTDTRMYGGVPASVMNTYFIGGNSYAGLYGHYNSELFKNNNFATISWNAATYASSVYPEFKEPEIEVLKEHEIKDCVNESDPTHEHVDEEEHTEEEE